MYRCVDDIAICWLTVLLHTLTHTQIVVIYWQFLSSNRRIFCAECLLHQNSCVSKHMFVSRIDGWKFALTSPNSYFAYLLSVPPRTMANVRFCFIASFLKRSNSKKSNLLNHSFDRSIVMFVTAPNGEKLKFSRDYIIILLCKNNVMCFRGF